MRQRDGIFIQLACTWLLQAMLHNAEKAFGSLGSMLGEQALIHPSGLQLPMSAINPELLTNFRLGPSIEAALAAKKAGQSSDVATVSRVSVPAAACA